MEMSREPWHWIATGGMEGWLGKCSIFQNKEKSKRKQSEMSRELWLASNRGWWWTSWESNASNVSPHPLISLDSLTQNSSFIFRPFHNSKFTCIGLFAAVLIHLVYVLQVAAVSKCWQGSALTSDTYSLIFPEISQASCSCSTISAKSLLASSVSKPRLFSLETLNAHHAIDSKITQPQSFG